MADSVGTEALFSYVSNFVMPRLLKDVRRDCAHKKTGIMSSDMVPVFYERSRVKVKRFSGLLQKSWSLRKSRKSEAHRANFLLHNQNVSGKQKAS